MLLDICEEANCTGIGPLIQAIRTSLAVIVNPSPSIAPSFEAKLAGRRTKRTSTTRGYETQSLCCEQCPSSWCIRKASGISNLGVLHDVRELGLLENLRKSADKITARKAIQSACDATARTKQVRATYKTKSKKQVNIMSIKSLG